MKSNYISQNGWKKVTHYFVYFMLFMICSSFVVSSVGADEPVVGTIITKPSEDTSEASEVSAVASEITAESSSESEVTREATTPSSSPSSSVSRDTSITPSSSSSTSSSDDVYTSDPVDDRQITEEDDSSGILNTDEDTLLSEENIPTCFHSILNSVDIYADYVIAEEEKTAEAAEQITESSGGQNTFTFTPESVSISQVEIIPRTSLGAIKAVVSDNPDTSKELSQILEKEDYIIHEYVEVLLVEENSILPTSNIETVTIKFKVDKAWIEQNNIDIETIIIKEYSESSPLTSNEWTTLSPVLVSESEDFLVYEVVKAPDCLSTFAIVGKEVVEVKPYQTQELGIPWGGIIGVVIVASFLLVFFVFKAGYIYTDEELHIKKSKRTLLYGNRARLRRSFAVLFFRI